MIYVFKCHQCRSTCVFTTDVGDERMYLALPPTNCCPLRDPQEKWEVIE